MMRVTASGTAGVSMAPSTSIRTRAAVGGARSSGDVATMTTTLSASPLTTRFGLWVAKMTWRLDLDDRIRLTIRMMTFGRNDAGGASAA